MIKETKKIGSALMSWKVENDTRFRFRENMWIGDIPLNLKYHNSSLKDATTKEGMK